MSVGFKIVVAVLIAGAVPFALGYRKQVVVAAVLAPILILAIGPYTDLL